MSCHSGLFLCTRVRIPHPTDTSDIPPNGNQMEFDFATGFVWFSAFLFSTTVHEAMHAFAAWRLGDPTAYHGGQVSLHPVPHIEREPIGMLVLPL